MQKVCHSLDLTAFMNQQIVLSWLCKIADAAQQRATTPVAGLPVLLGGAPTRGGFRFGVLWFGVLDSARGALGLALRSRSLVAHALHKIAGLGS